VPEAESSEKGGGATSPRTQKGSGEKEKEKGKSGRAKGKAREHWNSKEVHHPGGNPGANLKSISHRCHPILVVELTKETIDLPLGCLQGGDPEAG